LEKGLKVTVSGEGVTINKGGRIVLNAAKFSSIVKNLPDGDVHIASDDNFAVNIKSGRSAFTLHGLDAETFPLMPELAGDKSFKLPRKILRNMLASTLFSVGVNSSRPVLNGALFEIKNNQLNVVCTDGNRLSLSRNFEGITSDSDSNGELDINFVVPGKSLAELLKMIGDDEEPAEIELTSKHAIISFDNIVFFSRLIESEYLDYRRVIRNEPKTTVVIDTRSFLGSIERAAILVDDRPEIRLAFKKEEINLENKEEAGVMQVTSAGSIGKVNDECDIEIYGEDLPLIAFNHRYLHEALRAVKDEKILIKLESAMKCLVILPYDEKNGNNKDTTDFDGGKFLYLVLPVRMRD
jgi:DNA polymerase-3 subunit beta